MGDDGIISVGCFVMMLISAIFVIAGLLRLCGML